jgi:hypothetical protein
MPFLFIGSGIVLVFVGLQGDPAKLYALIADDFTGPNSFVYWMVAILILGALGYINGLDRLSRLFMLLVLLALLLTRNPTTGEAAGVTFVHIFQDFLAASTNQPAKQGAQ